MKPDSTIIWVTCRNYEHFLGEALLSAHTQSVRCPVVVAHDDCGGDKPVGLAANRNKLLSSRYCAHYSYVVFLDADDKLPPTYVESLLQKSEGRECVVTCPAELFGDETGTITPISVVTPELLVLGNTIHCSALIPIAALRGLGGYDQTLSAWEDWELWVRMAYRGVPFCSTDTTKLMYRRHAGSMNRVFGSTMDEMRETLKKKYIEERA